jgi:maltose/moltooligosaccharide transporter
MPPTFVNNKQSAARDAMTFDVATGAMAAEKKMNFLQLMNISIGFLGIQFAWAIQMGQMSPLLESLGSNPQLMGLISCAGPVTGVLVQPIIGAMSDDSKSRFGRRRPFLLAGALLTAISLILMPNSANLLMAAILLWILDASINISQGPYRALVPDVVPKRQQATAYSLMSLTIGLGSVAAFLIASFIPSMHNLFYMGASAMLLAMGWTILSTPEKAAAQATASTKAETPKENFLVSSLKAITVMPAEGKKLCLAHSFTWFGLMCLFTFFSVYVPHNIFGAADPASQPYKDGVQWASLCYAVLNTVCFLFSAVIGKLSNLTSKKAVHTFGLLCMAVSLISMIFLTTPVEVMIAMGFIGIGWATTLSLPFALLSDHMPKGREGVLMGVFNVFIAAPGILSNLLVGNLVAMYADNRAVAMVAGGLSMVLAAISLQFVREEREGDARKGTPGGKLMPEGAAG